MKMKMKMSSASGKTCGDGGDATLASTNVPHFHGLNVPPVCHQDDVLDTLIQPGSPGLNYSIQIPAYKSRPPWIGTIRMCDGFTEFQMIRARLAPSLLKASKNIGPEVQGLFERVFVIRQEIPLSPPSPELIS